MRFVILSIDVVLLEWKKMIDRNCKITTRYKNAARCLQYTCLFTRM